MIRLRGVSSPNQRKSLTGHTVRAPADALLVFAAAEQHMDRMLVSLQTLHQRGELLVALDVMLVHHDAAAVVALEANRL